MHVSTGTACATRDVFAARQYYDEVCAAHAHEPPLAELVLEEIVPGAGMAGNHCLPADDARLSELCREGRQAVIFDALAIAEREGHLRAIHVLVTEIALLAVDASIEDCHRLFGSAACDSKTRDLAEYVNALAAMDELM